MNIKIVLISCIMFLPVELPSHAMCESPFPIATLSTGTVGVIGSGFAWCIASCIKHHRAGYIPVQSQDPAHTGYHDNIDKKFAVAMRVIVPIFAMSAICTIFGWSYLLICNIPTKN